MPVRPHHRGLRPSLFVLALVASTWVPLWPGSAPPPTAQAPAPVDFAAQIEPILVENCYTCHGPEKSRGKLRLHVKDLALKGGATGPLLVPGDSEDSYILQRLLGQGDEDRMPLDEPPLSDAQIATIRAWIDQGAEWPASAGATSQPDVVEHWAYKPPVKAALPQVATSSWSRTPVDRFVLARLEAERLMPAHEAPRETLLRRVTLDLTGLPPSIEEVDAFVADRRADAYERVVDRLLASPHFGERWARLWLDLARYADTNGYEKDRGRSIWAYRDWVIQAFNEDMPFDRFTIEQIAGDMLPEPTRAQRVATGFHRNAMTNEEGGVDPDEAMYEVLVDRVNTTSTVWLGITLGCAQCHNHKYDPFSQKDYFRLMAFFANTARSSQTFGDGTRYAEPVLDLATPEQDASRKVLRTRLDALQAAMKKETPDRAAAQAAWEAEALGYVKDWTPLTPAAARATGDVQLRVHPDGAVLAGGPNPEVTVYTVQASTAATGITGLRLEVLLDPSLPHGGPGRDPYGQFRLTGLRVLASPAGDPARKAPVTFASGNADGRAYRFDVVELTRPAKNGSERKGQAWAVNAMRDGWRVPHQLVLATASPIGFPEGTDLTIELAHEDGTLGQGLGRFRLSVTTAPDPERIAAVNARTRAWLQVPAASRTDAQRTDVATQFRQGSPLFAAERKEIEGLEKQIADLDLPSTLVMQEKPTFERPSTPLRERGAFTSPGERVYAATPSALPPMDERLPANRLGLGRWLVDPDNPLTARVAVNRVWEALFGRGLVETSEDFGTMASPPSHPQLLDWLAVDFVEQGWSTKTLLRTIVTSATYRQESRMTAVAHATDPDNRLLARGPRFRMEAEMVRDLALAVSAQLSRRIGGPSVFPSQPDGVWDIPFSDEKWVESTGDDRHRRSLYTFVKRTAPYPIFMAFDATSREFCTVRRVRTNTPLQALATLNDDGFFESARALGARLRQHAKDGVDARLIYGFRLVTSRAPDQAELDRLRQFYKQARARYTREPAQAADALALKDTAEVGSDQIDLAAWTMVANVLLNLDETITKG